MSIFSRSLLLLTLGALPLFAQNPPVRKPNVIAPAPPDVPVGDEEAKDVAPQPVVDPVVENELKNTLITERIEQPKLSGDALATLYRKYTGRRVIVTSAASAAEFSFVQDASRKDPLTYGQAAELLRKAAVLENFVFVVHPQDKNLDILTLATGGVRPGNVNVQVYNENTPLPQTDIVITYVMTLDHIKPDQALNIFTQVIGQFGPYGSIAPVPNASAIVITEKASLIQSLIELQQTIDVPGSVQSTRFIKVNYADVTEIVETLTNLLSAQQGADGTAPSGGGNPIPAATSSTGGGEATPVQILPDPRTNRIFAMGRPVDLLFVEGLVREFDVPTNEKIFLRRKLRFLTVSEFLPIASDAITRAFSGTGDAGGGGAAGNRTTGNRTSSLNRNRTQNTNNRSGFGNSSTGGRNNSFGGGGIGGGGFGGGGIGGGNALGNPQISSAPESVLVGRTLLVADNITNSIVAQGPPSALEIIERLLDQIDVKPEQVMISTVIGQLTHDNDRELGVNYLLRSENFRGGGGVGPILPILPTPDGGVPSFPVPDPSGIVGTGLRAYGTIDNLTYFVNALRQRANFTVLSRPSIFTSNNQRGSISSGERIAIPTNTNSFAAGGASTNIEYQDVVLRLEVIPLVNSDNEITMQVALLNDEQNGTQMIQGAGSNGDDLTVPRISTREIITTVTIPNNDTIVLGGLIIGRSGTNKSGIPILNDIPYLGNLFGRTQQEQSRTELLVFMQPSIVKSASSLRGVQSDFDNRYRISDDVADFAEGTAPLPGEEEANAPNFWDRMKESNANGNSVDRPTIRSRSRR